LIKSSGSSREEEVIPSVLSYLHSTGQRDSETLPSNRMRAHTHTYTHTHTHTHEEPALSLLPPLEVKLSQYRNTTNKLPPESYSRILWLLRSAILTEEVRKRRRRGEEY